ncbi:hypothetical protein HY491_02640, partial [Candidatus Woesearchaeota archaeon]|nr:hypothetical protein [Candidatus Woesearchaeota archaeon]
MAAEQAGKDFATGYTANITGISRFNAAVPDKIFVYNITSNTAAKFLFEKEVTYLKNATLGETYQGYQINITII